MTSLWQANITRRSAPLSGSVNADITVIGGGITGLSAALHCARLMPGARIVLLERGRVGDGSTGRSSGVLSTETALADEPELHSAPSSGIATDIPKNPFEHLIGFIEAEAIDCDLQLTGSRAMRMPHAKGGPKVTTASEAGRGFSDRSHLTGAVRIHPLPISWATIHPVKLLNGLRAMAEEAGVTIYESTEVVSLRDGVILGCISPTGSVETSYALLCTNAYPPLLPRLGSAVLPLQLFAIATDIVPERYLDAGAWREMPLRTDAAGRLTFRLTPDNRILVRGGVRYHPFGRYGEKVPRAPIRALTDSLHRHDPALRAIDCAYQWTGLLGRTRTGRPLMGRAGRDGRILYAIGFNGFGLVDGFEAGRRLALRTVAPGRDAGFAADPPRWKTVYPPEPLRYLVVNAILALRAWR